MTIKDFHDSIRELVNIGQGQYYPPETLDLFIQTSLDDLFRQEFNHFEATQQITDTLGYFKTTSIPLVLENGMATLPANFYHLTGVEAITKDDNRVICEVLKDGHWFDRKHSKGYPPSDEYPIGRQIGLAKIEALPSTIKELVILYLRQPAKVKFAYTLSPSKTGFIYNESDSTQVDWPQIDHPRIQDKVLSLIGLPLRSKELIEHETVKKNQNENA